jgi:parallel beta-helix repeat protein
MDGILLAGSKDCSLMNITIGNNREPIVYQGVPLIYGGITLFESDNNTIANTKIYNNSYGVCQYHSDSNVFYHNSFINVHKPVISDYTSIFRNASSGYVSHAVWDNGVEGNFWSDYKGGDADHDGIGDAPYEIDGNNVDNHPLMGTYCEFLLSFFSNRSVAVTVISNSTVSDMAYAIWLSTPYDGLQPGQPFITFSVTGQNGTLGFCRLMFPRTVLNDSTYTVLVDSQRVNATEMSISNSTYVYLYFTYPHSAHEVMVTVPEFSWLVVPLFMIATLVAAIFYRRSIARNDLNDGNHSLVLTRFAIRELFGSAERQRF